LLPWLLPRHFLSSLAAARSGPDRLAIDMGGAGRRRARSAYRGILQTHPCTIAATLGHIMRKLLACQLISARGVKIPRPRDIARLEEQHGTTVSGPMLLADDTREGQSLSFRIPAATVPMRSDLDVQPMVRFRSPRPR
jgi:hypothetical protein